VCTGVATYRTTSSSLYRIPLKAFVHYTLTSICQESNTTLKENYSIPVQIFTPLNVLSDCPYQDHFLLIQAVETVVHQDIYATTDYNNFYALLVVYG